MVMDIGVNIENIMGYIKQEKRLNSTSGCHSGAQVKMASKNSLKYDHERNEFGNIVRTNKPTLQMPITVQRGQGGKEDKEAGIPTFVLPLNQLSMISDFQQSGVLSAGFDNDSMEDSVLFGDVESVGVPEMNYTMVVVGGDEKGNLAIQKTRQKRPSTREGRKVDGQQPLSEAEKEQEVLLGPLLVSSAELRRRKASEHKMSRHKKKDENTLRDAYGRTFATVKHLSLDGLKKMTRKEMMQSKSLKGSMFSKSGQSIERPDSPSSSFDSRSILNEASLQSLEDQGFFDENDKREPSIIPVPSQIIEETSLGGDDSHASIELGDIAHIALENDEDDERSLLTEPSFDRAVERMSPLETHMTSVSDVEMNQPSPPYRKFLRPINKEMSMTGRRTPMNRKDRNRSIHTPIGRLDSARFLRANVVLDRGDGPSAHSVHNRMMGWKLTSPKRRKHLLRLLKDMTDYRSAEGSILVKSDTEMLEEQRRQKRVDKRQTDAYANSISRAILARAATPKGRMTMLMSAKKDSTVAQVLVDRMSIIKNSEQILHDEAEQEAQKSKQMEQRPMRAQSSLPTDVGMNHLSPTIGFPSLVSKDLHSGDLQLLDMHHKEFPMPKGQTSSLDGMSDSLPASRGGGSRAGGVTGNSFLVNMPSPVDMDMPFNDSLVLASTEFTR